MTNDQETYRCALPDTPPHISYGIPFYESCAKHVNETFDAKRVYIIASGSLSRDTDNITKLEDALGDKVAGVCRGMTPHTLWSEVLEITHEAREAKVDLIITCGAGSLTDGAKVIALALANNASNADDLDTMHLGRNHNVIHTEIKAPTIPIVSIPTSLSGGEYTRGAGATDDRNHRKRLFREPCQGPLLVILDPQLTTTTPDSVWLSSGIRAVDHCVEAMCSLSSTPSAVKRATKGLKALVPGLLRCKANKTDLEARLACQLGVIDAIAAVFVEKVPLGASHGIGHQLGPLGVGHGETSCIMLPAVCKYNFPINSAQQNNVSKIFWDDEMVKNVLHNHGLKEQKADLSDCLKAIIKELGLPGSLEAWKL
ncbi:hypothetical protein AUEXF2481DRAFT_32381 [Aureobasidium subglaciale EXF-2481]|uniref:Uncharacterized protein n=1 Tax=Aureobasidium subglaciale (strain EXF-2481) TaxID=1043005 RepID=A0A074YDL8_AURSE|nr:uncharacterized protein AUEXF2481DRAFT_32381 [Aureobasidium subglaciale EXF-2481]KEQ92177.1 hypothetical protein AUEXF2481DRAFT_32381 [Aureobasidium subglaciale EXF-2481]